MALTIVGCGPGSPDLLTAQARAVAQEAEVLVGARRLLELFPARGEERLVVGRDIEGVLEEIARRLPRPTVVLVSGDPGLCSLAKPVLRRFGRERCTVIPAVSSVQVAFARLGLDWLDARFLSAHHKNPDIDPQTLREVGKIAVLGGRPESVPWVADLLDALGPGRRVFVCENLTLPDERVREVSPADLPKLEAASRTILLLIREELL